MAGERPGVLIERWLPVQELGIESRRENSTGQHPPPNRLHVWWARRPLTVSRAAILASLLPPDTDHTWFLRILGIFGDPVRAYQEILKARGTGKRLGDPYGYKRAFTYTPDEGTLEEIRRRIAEHWGRDMLVFLDPMAGGGSIPFEAMRYGLEVWANELNPVACVILKATLEYPAYFGEALADDIERWAGEVHRRAKAELERFYPCLPGEQVFAYVWAHTVKCPSCGLVVPLSPNWWLERGQRQIAAKPVVKGESVHFEIVENPEAAGFDPNQGTQRRGSATCPGCHNTISGDAIKSQAQSGRMGYQLVALVVKRNGKREYRLPGKADLKAVEAAEEYLRAKWDEFEAMGLIPDEQIPEGNKTAEPRRYGMKLWRDMFTPRQLLSHVVHLKYIREVGQEMAKQYGAANGGEGRLRWEAVMTYLALILDKSVDWSCRMTSWVGPHSSLKHLFESSAFPFKWSFGEFDGARMLWPWGTEQVLDAYRQLATLAKPYRMFHPVAAGASGSNPGSSTQQADCGDGPEIHVTQGNAATYFELPDASVDLIVVDPPYYDNVMYAECSDFFYVWQKRILGDVFPQWFSGELTDKQQEAVANVALFRERSGARELARRDYEEKMKAAFRRMHGLLKDDGVMVVMFTHKQVEAWDALATALIEGGWEITASWPVHTEKEDRVRQAKANAAQSTILLVCRKREQKRDGGWWSEVEGEIERVVKERVAEYEALGIRGVDLMLACFGPALQVICQHWPVRLPSGEAITPDYALDLARRTVQRHRWIKLVGKYDVDVDDVTQFVIYAWDLFKAEQIRFDEGRKLYMNIGVAEDELKRRKVIAKKDQYMRLLGPEERARKGGFDPEAEAFDVVIDALHAAIWWYQDGGLGAVRRFFERTKLNEDSQFLAGMQAYLRALPTVRDEFNALREIADALLHGRIEIPKSTGQLPLGLSEDGRE